MSYRNSNSLSSVKSDGTAVTEIAEKIEIHNPSKTINEIICVFFGRFIFSNAILNLFLIFLIN